MTEKVWALVKPADGPCRMELVDAIPSTVTSLYTARVTAQLALRDVAAQLGVTPATLSGWEHGRDWPDNDTLLRLWRILRREEPSR